MTHNIYVYLVDGKAKPSAEALYLKRGEKVQWLSGTKGVEFLIKFDKNGGNPFSNNPYEEQTPTSDKPTTKLGQFDYSITDQKNSVLVDPSVDVGDPGP